jgi:hypothetical protein
MLTELDASKLQMMMDWFLDSKAVAPPGVEQGKTQMAVPFLDHLFYQAPLLELDEAKVTVFEAIIERFQQNPGSDIPWDPQYPKADFLRVPGSKL